MSIANTWIVSSCILMDLLLGPCSLLRALFTLELHAGKTRVGKQQRLIAALIADCVLSFACALSANVSPSMIC